MHQLLHPSLVRRAAALALFVGLFALPLAYADASITISLQSLSPGDTVAAGKTVSFTVAASGLTDAVYTMSDSFRGTSLKNSNLDANGHFSWTPQNSDAGVHTLTITVGNIVGTYATLTQKITVTGTGEDASDVSIQNLSPGKTIAAGTRLTFKASVSGLSNPTYTVSETFTGGGSSLSSSNIDSSSGSFSWTPKQIDVGRHELTVTALEWTGKTKTADLTITVTEAGSSSAPSTPSTPATGTATGSSGLTQAQVQAILSLLQSFNADQSVISSVSASLSGKTTTNTTTAAGYTFTSFLSYGSNGDEVLALQKKLAVLGYLTAAPNGHFGPATQAAVKAFQKAKGISAVGYVGPATRAALNK